MLPDGVFSWGMSLVFLILQFYFLLFSVNYVRLGRYLFIFVFPLVFSGSIGVKMGKSVALQGRNMGFDFRFIWLI